MPMPPPMDQNSIPCVVLNYNSRPLPAEILVDGNTARIVRKRQNLDDLIAGEA